MLKKLSSSALIRFQDCDPLNHLNNAKYLDYFINAREDQVLKAYDIDIFRHMKQTGKSWVVRSNQISYVRPARVMEEVTIHSQLIDFSEHNLSVEMTMWDKKETHIKSIFWVKFTYFDISTQKSAVHESNLLDIFKHVVNPIEDHFFEDRVTSILKALK